MGVRASNTEANTPVDLGSAQQAFLPASLHGLAAAIAANGNITSNVIPSLGWQKGGVGLKSSQAGQLSVQRYLDQDGQILVGAAITAALAANTAAAVTWDDGLPYGSFQITVTNTAGAAAVLSDITMLLQSN